MNDTAADVVFKALETNQSVVSLSLSNSNECRNTLTIDSWMRLGEVLSKNKIISILNLPNNSLRNEGFKHIVSGLVA